jgi:hypothetical protein
MEMNAQAQAATMPAPAMPVVAATEPKAAKAKGNPLVEVMEGVTLSALLILFTFLYMFGAFYILNPAA